ncbi:MAG: hypothetical protein Q8O81_14120 [Giesbergeria sp.]|nr:hypothetical protein [Giesbergeria sp.]
MNLELLKSVAQVAAPAGIAIGVFLYVARDVVAKNIFPNLTKQQSFRLIMFVVFAAWTVALAAIAAWAYVALPRMGNATAATTHYPPFSMETLKNLTYRIGTDSITLQDGKREFIPDLDHGSHEKAIAVHLTDHAFGDLDDDGNTDAIAILQVTDGGTGIYYYLAAIFNDKGTAKQFGKAYVLGDRLHFRSISVSDGEVAMELMMHGSNDALCCPTQFRSLEFRVKDRTLQCNTEPCSEV